MENILSNQTIKNLNQLFKKLYTSTIDEWVTSEIRGISPDGICIDEYCGIEDVCECGKEKTWVC